MQPDPEQVSPGPGALQCFTTLTVVLGSMWQLAEAAGALESISVVPKNPNAVAVLVAVRLAAVRMVSVAVAVNVAVAPGASVFDERVGCETTEPPGNVSFTWTLDKVPTPELWTDPTQL